MELNKDKTLQGKVRIDILNASFNAGRNGAHIAPSLSVADICLFVLKVLKENDSFILSKGHGALGYYAAMHQTGMISDEQFESFEKNGGDFPGQPSRSENNGIEYSSGSLGMGLSYALGVALSKKTIPLSVCSSIGDGERDEQNTGIIRPKVYVVTGDGELDEGSNWEAVALISRYNLENLILVVDNNGLQSDGECEDVAGQNFSALFKSHGWEVFECDGHSVYAMETALKSRHEGKPLAVIAKTVKGKGVSFMENDNSWHHAVLKEADYLKAVQEVKGSYGLC